MRFLQGDVFALDQALGATTFELVTMMQTLLLFDRATYPRVIEALLQRAKGWVILSTLLSDHKVDLASAITDRSGAEEKTYTYHSWHRDDFIETCERASAKEVRIERFDIGIDLAKTDGGIGTYTIRAVEGPRLQISADVLMTWHTVGLRA
jgi:hypothetical protein